MVSESSSSVVSESESHSVMSVVGDESINLTGNEWMLEIFLVMGHLRERGSLAETSGSEFAIRGVSWWFSDKESFAEAGNMGWVPDV